MEMSWLEFMEAHFRPHLVTAQFADAAGKDAGLEIVDQLVAILAVPGNFAVSREKDQVRFAFEKEDAAESLSDVLAAERLDGDDEWSSRALAQVGKAARQRLAALVSKYRGRRADS